VRDEGADVVTASSLADAFQIVASTEELRLVLASRPHDGDNGFCRRVKHQLGARAPLIVLCRPATGGVAGSTIETEEEADFYIEESLEPQTRATNVKTLLRLARAEEDRGRLLAQEQAARADAEAATQAKDEFLALVSHEIRTPLNAILGWAQVLRTSLADKEVAAHAAAAIERNAFMQKKLIGDLLDHSRVIRGQLRLEVRPVDLRHVVEAACDATRPAAAAKSITLSLSADPAVGGIAGDADRLQQAVWNLLSNAVKFTPSGGRVDVHLERVDPHARITVTDTGRGIAEKFLPHVFEQYRQADESGVPRQGGLGLGLTLARRIIELHGGSIHAASPGVDQGATFSINLPLPALRLAGGAGTPRPAIDEVAPATSGKLDGLWVLVVDDEPDARDLLDVALRQYGADVTAVSSAAEAFTVISEGRNSRRPDLLISDIGMPIESGYDLIQRVRALPPDLGGLIPAVALTAYSRPSDRLRALSAGFQNHVAKPTDPAELALVAASLVGRVGGRGAPS
jgi:signal transduction histidine kinase/CheY-like chemotaxis protein